MFFDNSVDMMTIPELVEYYYNEFMKSDKGR